MPTKSKGVSASQTEYDAIVVGGGLSGLIAARELHQLGIRVLVIEARDRLGGRIWTAPHFGAERDLGATFLHWTQPHIWAEVARYGLQLAQRPPLAETVWLACGERFAGGPAALQSLIASGMEQYCYGASAFFPRPYDPIFAPLVPDLDIRSMADPLAELDADEPARALIRSFWSVNCNADCSFGSFAHVLHWCALTGGSWRLFNEACARYKLQSGMSTLVNCLTATGFSTQLSSAVSRIEQGKTDVLVGLASGHERRARTCVVALPLNVLGTVDFAPRLSEAKETLIAEDAPKEGFKMWIQLRDRIEPGLWMAAADVPLMFARYEAELASGSLLSAYGADRSNLESGAREIAQLAVSSWHRGLTVEECWVYDWVGDPYALETWRVPRPKQRTSFGEELLQPEGRVFLAGADVARGWCGFMDGAVESGLTAARQVANRLRPPRAPKEA